MSNDAGSVIPEGLSIYPRSSVKEGDSAFFLGEKLA